MELQRGGVSVRSVGVGAVFLFLGVVGRLSAMERELVVLVLVCRNGSIK